MKVLIIEDELPARAKLESMLQRLDSSVTIVAATGSVKETVRWLEKNAMPDLAFVDIQLSDDHSFEIFRNYPVQFPVIFTTAFDKYLLESFEFNSIDYLLKPITEEKLKRSLEKIKNLRQHFTRENLEKFLQEDQRSIGRTRIIGKKGTEFIALNMQEIAYFFTEHKIVFAKDGNGKQFIISKNLSELQQELDHEKFFRVNRKFLVNAAAIERFRPDNGKIRIFLNPDMKEEIHVSKETAPEFRKWIGMDNKG